MLFLRQRALKMNFETIGWLRPNADDKKQECCIFNVKNSNADLFLTYTSSLISFFYLLKVDALVFMWL